MLSGVKKQKSKSDSVPNQIQHHRSSFSIQLRDDQWSRTQPDTDPDSGSDFTFDSDFDFDFEAYGATARWNNKFKQWKWFDLILERVLASLTTSEVTRDSNTKKLNKQKWMKTKEMN